MANPSRWDACQSGPELPPRLQAVRSIVAYGLGRLAGAISKGLVFQALQVVRDDASVVAVLSAISYHWWRAHEIKSRIVDCCRSKAACTAHFVEPQLYMCKNTPNMHCLMNSNR